MEREDFNNLARFVKAGSGLSLNPDKAAMTEGRLLSVARRHGFAGVAQLVRKLDAANAALQDAVIEALTTHDTAFFRDAKIFAAFRDRMLPSLIAAKAPDKALRIWSTGCSSGQEPYSLAMIMDASPHSGGRPFEILATDMSAEIIARASEGKYSAEEVRRGLPIAMLGKYFERAQSEWRILRALRERVRFRVVNLLESFDEFGMFDIIFCRNVLIYFDTTAKAAILARLERALVTGGLLVLGEAEMALGMEEYTGVPGAFVKTDVLSRHRVAALAAG